MFQKGYIVNTLACGQGFVYLPYISRTYTLLANIHNINTYLLPMYYGFRKLAK